MATTAELAAHQARMAERRRKGAAFLAQVEADKGRPLCLTCDTVGTAGPVKCEKHQ